MKGYANLLMGWVIMLIIFFLVNGYLQTRFKTEVFVTDAVAENYKMINDIEFTKLNIKQDINFSIQKTKQDLKILMIDETNQKLFLDKFKSNFHPSQEFSDIDVSISVNSIELTNSKLIANTTIISSSTFKKAESDVIFISPIE